MVNKGKRKINRYTVMGDDLLSSVGGLCNYPIAGCDDEDVNDAITRAGGKTSGHENGQNKCKSGDT